MYDELNHKSDSLRNFVSMFFRRKKLISLVFAVVVAVITMVTFLSSPVFKSSGKILVEREVGSDKALLFRLNLPVSSEGYDWVKSEIEMMTSYPVVAQVLKELGSDDLGKGMAATVGENSLQFEKAVKKVYKRLTVENPRNSNVIDVTYESKDPKLAAATVNRLIEIFMERRAQIFSETDTYKFFEEQIRMADDRLRELESRIYEYKKEAEIISPEKQGEILLTKLADYERSLTTVQTRRIGKEAKLSVIIDQLQTGSDVDIPSTDVSDSPSQEKYIAKLKGELLDMKIQRDQLLQRFQPTYEEVVELGQRITATQEIIKNEIQQIVGQEKNAIRALQAEEQALKNSIGSINEQIRSFAKKEYEFMQLSRGIDDNQEVYSMLLKQREEARISLAKIERLVKIRTISPAVVSHEPVKPRKRLNLALGMVLGLMAGLGLAFFVDNNDHTIRSPAELEKYTGLTLLGAVDDVNKKDADRNKRSIGFTRPS